MEEREFVQSAHAKPGLVCPISHLLGSKLFSNKHYFDEQAMHATLLKSKNLVYN